MSMNIKKDHRTQINQKTQKRKVLEELVSLQEPSISIIDKF